MNIYKVLFFILIFAIGITIGGLVWVLNLTPTHYLEPRQVNKTDSIVAYVSDVYKIPKNNNY